MNEVAPGIWRWTARHPEWHPGEWGAEVGCYALAGGGRTVLIDPLAPAGDGGFWERLDGVVAGPLICLITIGYHLRSAGWPTAIPPQRAIASAVLRTW